MAAQRFIQSHKCDCFEPFNYCNCSKKSNAPEVLLENVKKVVQTLVEVMKLCYIPARKASLAMDVVSNFFLHFEEVRQRIDTVPKKRLCKADLFLDLCRKCDMTRKESQMAYSIIKRAFRAFYHGTGEGGVPNHMLAKQLRHSSACMWLHASRRTAQIFSAYEGLSKATQKDIECRIKELYSDLYDRLYPAEPEEDNHECCCPKCAKRIMMESLKTVRVTTGMHHVNDPYEAMYRQMVDQMMRVQEEDLANENPDSSGRVEKECTCPPFVMGDSDYMYRQTAKLCETGFSQGPFACHWCPISKEEYEDNDDDPVIKLPEEHPCPSCNQEMSSCDSECVCDCEHCACHTDEELSCAVEESFGDDVDMEVAEELGQEELTDVTSSHKDENSDPKEFHIKFCGCKDPRKFLKTTGDHAVREILGGTESDLKSKDKTSADQRLTLTPSADQVEF